MAKIIHHCPICERAAELVSEYNVDSLKIKNFSCGHHTSKPLCKPSDFADFVSIDGKKPRNYQIEGATFGLNADARVLIADEMGLGKTIQAGMICQQLIGQPISLFFAQNQKAPKNRKKYIIVCKKKLQIQMLREFNRWLRYSSQIIKSENDYILPVDGFIISYDTLWRFKDIPAFVKRANLENGILILDECQHIKNSQAKRTQGVRELSRNIEHCIALSGTPIKNHAGEFFPILNILRPDRYPSQTQFEHLECETYQSGYSYKIGGLKDAQRFYDKNKDFIIRRLKKDVAPELPEISEQTMFIELGPEVEKLYVEELKKFQQFYNYGSTGMTAFQKHTEILGYLNKMRHLTGIAKCLPVLEFTQDFLDSTDRKIAIFLHHKNVAKILFQKFAELGIEVADLLADSGQEQVDDFRNRKRLALCSTLASGEGLNLQFCSDFVQLERQWNYVNEAQVGGRFSRIGQLADKILGTFFVAVGTVDEFLVELIEKKKAIGANVLDRQQVDWSEASVIKELAEILASTGGRKWGF